MNVAGNNQKRGKLALKKSKGKYLFLSLSECARRLGVNKGHLSRVLRGERQSKSLLERYRALIRTVNLQRHNGGKS